MRISDWSSDVCSSDLAFISRIPTATSSNWRRRGSGRTTAPPDRPAESAADPIRHLRRDLIGRLIERDADRIGVDRRHRHRSEEHTSELQSLMRISYAVFCLKKKKN